MDADLSAARLDGERERTAAEAARTELAKSLLRLGLYAQRREIFLPSFEDILKTQ
jgi:hypothetical protein